jgi:acetyltransferase-like isoleucine patch superfamily enzyme
VIEDDAWLGAGCVILPGVRIGRGAVVGANSVVAADVPPLHVVAGQPARTVRELTPETGWR